MPDTELNMSPVQVIPVVSSHPIGDYLPVIPAYDGTTSIKIFLDKFLRIADYCGWSDRDKLMVLDLKLIGEAQEFTSSQRNVNKSMSFKQLTDALIERFSIKQSVASAINRLTQSYQLPGESARQFFSRIENLSYNCLPAKSSPEFESYRLQLLLSAAKQGIRPEILKGIVSSGLTDFSEFKKHALNFEETLNLCSHVESAAVSQKLQSVIKASEAPDDLEYMKKQIIELKNSIDQLKVSITEIPRPSQPRPNPNNSQFQNNRRNPQNDSRVCFKCNTQGHIARNCTKLICNFCKRVGHSEDRCFRKNRQQQPNLN